MDISYYASQLSYLNPTLDISLASTFSSSQAMDIEMRFSHKCHSHQNHMQEKALCLNNLTNNKIARCEKERIKLLTFSGRQ